MGRAGTEAQAIAGAPRGRRIAVDFDSTAWPFHTAYGSHPECPPFRGERLSGTNWESWDTPVEMLLDRFRGEDGQPDMPTLFHEMQRMMDESRSAEMIARHGLFAGFHEAMIALQEAGYEPVIVTDNSDEGIEVVRRYLASQQLPLEVALAKMGQQKIDWCLANGAWLIVDDAPKTILAAHAAGLKPATLRYLYNAEAIAATGAIASTGWSELLPRLLSALRGEQELAA